MPISERAGAGDIDRSASKMDADKSPLFQGALAYFPRALLALARVSEYGFRKYGKWGGWRNVPDGVVRYTNGDARHLLKEEIEGRYDDQDSGLAHAVMHLWNAAARVELMIQQGAIEDRIGNDIVDGEPVLGTAREA